MPIDRFLTERLLVEDWRRTLANPDARSALEADLAKMLTDPVLKHLPPSLQVGEGDGAISAWIDARRAESHVLQVCWQHSAERVGLLILAEGAGISTRKTFHIGYLLDQRVWGQGVASELVSGLVSSMAASAPVRLIGGVEKNNPASARVLQKVGFEVDPEQSTPETDMYVCEID